MEAALSTPCPTPLNLHVKGLDDNDLEDAITTLAANIAAATWQLLTLIREFDHRDKLGGWGVKSCAHWLNWKCGIALGAAREKVRVARALEFLPLIDRVFAAGVLSYSKVRAMTRIATPENEDYLLMLAEHGTAAQLERLIRAFRRVKRVEETAKADGAQALRDVDWYYAEDGMFVIHARLPCEAGEMVMKALQAAAEDLVADRTLSQDEKKSAAVLPHLSAETWANAECPAGARRADALCHLAEQFLAQGAVGSKQADRHQIMVHVERDTLRSDGERIRCEFERGHPLAVETARRLACDASRVDIEEDEVGHVLNIGRKTRTAPPAIRRALEVRDQGCRFPGCTQHRYVDAHHIHHWADGGETSLRNLVLLCRYHHRLLHEGGFALELRDDGKLLFFRPDGVPVPEVPPPVLASRDITVDNEAAGIHVSAETCQPNWCGETMDLAMAVDGLVQTDDELRNLPATFEPA